MYRSIVVCHILFLANAVVSFFNLSDFSTRTESDECGLNRFGPSCEPCEKCSIGRCDDGKLGSGRCSHVTVQDACTVQTENGTIFVRGNAVITTLFYTRPNPQTGKYVSLAQEPWRRWFQSVQILGMSALVLHDGLPEHILAALNGTCTVTLQVSLNHRSVNDERFSLYRSLLQEGLRTHFGNRTVVLSSVDGMDTKLLFTDMLDVEFYRNPFEIFFGKKYALYVGMQASPWDRWIIARANACSTRLQQHKLRYYNAGILGGSIGNVKRFLDCYHTIAEELPRRSKKRNCNMVVFNQALVSCFHMTEIFTGKPLHSIFKAYEKNTTNIYIRHK